MPKGIQPNFNSNTSEQLILNPNKRSRTLKDEFLITRLPEGKIKKAQYSYELKEYKRIVKLEKIENQFLVSEIEISE